MKDSNIFLELDKLALNKVLIMDGAMGTMVQKYKLEELDFRGEPFGPMPELLAFADHVFKLKAICNSCGDDTFCLSQRLIDGKPAHYNDPLIVVGASQYEPRCRKCHIIRKD